MHYQLSNHAIHAFLFVILITPYRHNSFLQSALQLKYLQCRSVGYILPGQISMRSIRVLCTFLCEHCGVTFKIKVTEKPVSPLPFHFCMASLILFYSYFFLSLVTWLDQCPILSPQSLKWLQYWLLLLFTLSITCRNTYFPVAQLSLL